ncbi:3778_t:CDS:1 [Entrophospora sp. SA101]|nr:4171_t:CDS:1 [Entrophospora sp. SA101]CAJ0648275.1 1913_t:CDS:1 [Entrophospora sp. SA101]CAJ0746681.1 10620_t:CDS:1 [Entrophospora sp. SA101]CAJ0757580.1 2869_t:CDS:1 [Entrophospora sp. SA101]CAJ0768070.1 3778_t:CDS:1 [Entrophospora sp. SA101]
MALSLPTEILMEIFSNLPPRDLYSLSVTCKQYRTLLWSVTSTTQCIWRTSRQSFFEDLTLPPPEGMSEQYYIWLMVLLDKCQFCNEGAKFKLTMYWEFRMYCCESCLKERTISQQVLVNESRIPEILIPCMPYVRRNSDPCEPQLFLKKDVVSTLAFYENLIPEEKENWIILQKEKISKLSMDNEGYNIQHDRTRYDINELIVRTLSRYL